MAELHETRMGKTLIDHTFPKIAKQLERIADALELKNQVDTLIRAKQEEDKSTPEEQLKQITEGLNTIANVLVSVSHGVGH